MITLTDAFTRFDAGVTADTRTYNTREYTLPAKCPKQTPDGFSVPGWGGLAALPVGPEEGEGRSGSGSQTLKAPILGQEDYLASGLISVDKESLWVG